MISAAKRLVDDVYWIPAVFIGTVAGGVVWAIVARSTVFERNPDLSARDGWLVVGLGCLGVLLAGLALAVCAWANSRTIIGGKGGMGAGLPSPRPPWACAASSCCPCSRSAGLSN